MNIVFDGPAPTLRDWMAIMALPAIYEHQAKLTDLAADLAYAQADEMLRARAKPNGPIQPPASPSADEEKE